MPKVAKRKKRWQYAVWLGMAILLLVALVLWKITPKFEETIVKDQDPDAIKILFIGNSLTFTNHVPAQFVDIAKAQNSKIVMDVKQVAYPDYTLKDHWNRRRAQAAIESQKWDYVILQGHSNEPIKHPKRLRQYVKLFDEEAKDAHAKTILYATWTDSDKLELHNKIVKVFSHLASDANLTLAPVGESMYLSLKEYPKIHLLQPDKHHATDSGAYLVAATLYITIFKSKITTTAKAMPHSGIILDNSIKESLNSIAAKACARYHMLHEGTTADSLSTVVKEEESEEKLEVKESIPKSK